MTNYAEAKSILFRSLNKDGAAIVNTDDPAWVSMVHGCLARVVGCSMGPTLATAKEGPHALERCSAVVTGATAHRTDVLFRGPWTSSGIQSSLPFIGGHNIMNALEAAACVMTVGEASRQKLGAQALPAIEPTALFGTIESGRLPPGRLECLTSAADPVTVYIDYAHTDDALRTVLEVLRAAFASAGGASPPSSSGTLTVVFGCGGDRDSSKRPRMGAVAARLADKVVITSDNPRTEDSRRIIDDIVAGVAGPDLGKVAIEPDRGAAIHGAIRAAGSGEIVLIAGKGHEDYQILPAAPGSGSTADQPGGNSARAASTVTRFFDDRLVAQEALERRGIRVRPRANHNATRRPTLSHARSSARATHKATARPRT
jgi:UDP-N-acetylmuramyl tripeptide synthase